MISRSFTAISEIACSQETAAKLPSGIRLSGVVTRCLWSAYLETVSAFRQV